MDFKKDVELKKYTTFEIGGKADYFFVAKNKGDLLDIVKWAKDRKIPFLILGGGSNVLISDVGFRGLVIKLAMSSVLLLDGQNCLNAQSGGSLAKLVEQAYMQNLSGLEWAIGIPGSVGGAIVGNAGAYGQNMSDSIKNVLCLDTNSLEVVKFTKDECCFEYRKSLFKNNNKYIVLAADFVLEKKDSAQIKETMQTYLAERLKKQPLETLSAGCVFKNIEQCNLLPVALADLKNNNVEIFKYKRLPAAWFIEQCGLKGKKIGGAQISERHTNFIININNAKYDDVISLISLVEQKVYEKFMFKLEREIVIF